ncbi:MFS transporter [Micrococcoides hystricis]|uniref:MFS transporter n=1 Tax=Micrococcoides hystricis TaxID=1572761 RepID=A0ABV6PBC9_9MICC
MTADAERRRKMGNRAALSAFFGSTVEYYDFMLFASASALVFGPAFFSPLGELGSVLASLGTFGVAYIARPVGAIIFGGLGDRLGRKTALMWSLNLMALATVAIGLLPTYAQIGIMAPILLVLLRLVQGLSAGGEQVGSNSLSIEHAPEGKRGLYASWTMVGTTLGNVLGSSAFMFVALMPTEALLVYGWRIPFLIAGPLALVAVFIRRSVDETDSFKVAKATQQIERVPVAEVFTQHWHALLRVIGCCLLSVFGTLLMVYGLSLATSDEVGMDPAKYLLATTLGNFTQILVIPFWAKLSDRVGRRPIFAGSMVMAGLMMFPFLWAVNTGEFWPVLIGAVLLSGMGAGANGIQGSLYTEMFPARVRYTGVAVGTQLGYLIGGFAPAIAAALAGPSHNWLPVAIFGAVSLFISAGSAWSGRENSQLNLAALDQTGPAQKTPER